VKKQNGVTLVETMLVLVVGAFLLVLGVRVYNQLRQQVYERQLLGNVDQLFVASKNFYQSMCRVKLNSNGNALSPGLFDPRNTVFAMTTTTKTLSLGVDRPVTGAPVAVSSYLDLVSAGMLNQNDWKRNNPLVSSTATTLNITVPISYTINNDGYFVEFNRNLTASNDDQTNSVYAYICSGGPPGGPANSCALQSVARTSLDGTAPTLKSSVPLWDIKVAVQLRDCTKAVTYMNQLGATCIGKLSGQSITCQAIPINCANPATNDVYLVWQRPVALLTANQSSLLWPSMPMVKQFNMQYTNDGMSSLSRVTSNTNWYNIQSYLCGG